MTTEFALPNAAATMTLVAKFDGTLVLDEIYNIINDKVISMKYQKKKPIDADKMNRVEQTFIAMMNVISSGINTDHIDVVIGVNDKHRMVRLYQTSAILSACTSIQEGEQVLNEIIGGRVKVNEISETLVTYKYQIPKSVDLEKMKQHFRECSDFTMTDSQTYYTLTHGTNKFLIHGRKVAQTSKNSQESLVAFQMFAKELGI